MDEIADQAHANKAMIYYYFGNKAELYQAVLVRLFEGVRREIEPLISSASHPEERLRGIYQGLFLAFQKQPALPRVMLREMLAEGRHFSPDSAKLIQELLSEVRSTIESGQAKGIFRKVQPLLVHLNLLGMLLVFSVGEPLFRKRLVPMLGSDPGIPKPSELLEYLDQVLARTLTPAGPAGEREGSLT